MSLINIVVVMMNEPIEFIIVKLKRHTILDPKVDVFTMAQNIKRIMLVIHIVIVNYSDYDYIYFQFYFKT